MALDESGKLAFQFTVFITRPR